MREVILSDMELSKVYECPDIDVLEVFAEGVLCGSYDMDLNPEEGYM